MANAALGGVLESLVEKGFEVGICVAPLLINGAVALYSTYTCGGGKDAMKFQWPIKGWAHGARECLAGPCPSDKDAFSSGPYDVTKSFDVPQPFRTPSQPFRTPSHPFRSHSTAISSQPTSMAL
ncbi:hypothetical protein KFL_000040346 [Klebsormidium nitens]|uniref:Uncharacterized protein n=1 Tax=Klebsormidium nitens TaxID=105231 RepID=A0A1Y1HHB6_KLENI|nr:hypothetical protein KFL_000040346 [Klebsormidium nitens]|eukprot:GAQ77834.1 hypothetical protein KFL_000040346 [Klebsormidium nitens]